MRVLFLHNNFPGQYKHVAAKLAADSGNRIVGASLDNKKTLPGVVRFHYKPQREVNKSTHHYLRSTEAAVLDGQAVFRACVDMRKKGFVPDVVCSHSGWGTAFYVKDVFPETRLLSYFEWYYHARDSDVDYADQSVTYDDMCRIRTRNCPLLMDLAHSDWGQVPTGYQLSQIPPVFHSKLTQIHDGIDTEVLRPDPNARFAVPGVDVKAGDEILTYATRGMEPYRGFPEFMRAVAILQKQRPGMRTIIAGTDRVAYGKKLPEGESWKKKMLDELKDLDLSRIHFVGHLAYDNYVKLLQVSSVHIYLTIPFVLSWSLLESMAAGCLIVGSDSAPVREMIEDGKDGLLTEFLDHNKLVARIQEAFENRERYAPLRAAARAKIVERYDIRDLLPKQIEMIESLAAGRLPTHMACDPAAVARLAPILSQPVRVGAPGVAPAPAKVAAATAKPPPRKKSGRPANLPRGRGKRR